MSRRRRDTERDPNAAFDVLLPEGAPRLREHDVIADVYVVRQRIGVGGLAEVYEAWDSSAQRATALKVLRRDRLASTSAPSVLDRALVEQGRRLMELGPSDRVVHVHQVGTDPRTRVTFLAMDVLEGRDLLAQIRSGGPLEAVEAVAYGAVAAAGLALFHERGWVHGDVKPSNLFLHTPEGRAPMLKLLDPTPGARGDGQGAPVTTTSPLYTAPEFVERRELGPAYDVYALGLTLYELVLGTAPMGRGAARLTDVYRNQLSLELPPLASVLPRVPREVSEIVAKMTAKASSVRYPHAIKVAAVLSDCLSRLRAGPANLQPRARALELAPPSIPLSVSDTVTSLERPRYGLVAQVATVDVDEVARDQFGIDGVYELPLARLRRVDPTPPLGLSVLVVTEGPTRLLGLRYPIAAGVWKLGADPTCDLCVPHKSLRAREAELHVERTADGLRMTVRPTDPQTDDLEIDGQTVHREAFLEKGSRLSVGYVVLEWFDAGAKLPPDRAVQVALPPLVFARAARRPDIARRMDTTHRMFLARSPSPSLAMRDLAELQRMKAEGELAEFLLAVEHCVRDPAHRAHPERLALPLALAHEIETQLQILEGKPLEEILEKRLLPAFDWDELARARLAQPR